MGVKSIPSRLVYSVDVPEITNLNVNFVYNYYVPNESVRDKDILTDESIKQMNLSQNIISKLTSETDENYLDYKKIPRYVTITFSCPTTIPFLSSVDGFIEKNIDKIVDEEQFASKYYTAINFSNGNIDKQTSSIFNNSSKLLNDSDTKNGLSAAIYDNMSKTVGKSNLDIISKTLNQQDLANGTVFRTGSGKKVIQDYFSTLKTLNSYSQVSNNVLYDLAVHGLNDHFNLRKESLNKLSLFAKTHIKSNNNFHISDDEFKTSIPYYKVVSTVSDYDKSSNYSLAGYVIEKIEIFPDGSQKIHDPIVINNAGSTSYVDFNVRYGTVYVYRVKSIMEVTFISIDDSHNAATISSLISSKPTTATIETTENLGPPPPVELKFIWDYDKINPLTAQYDSISNKVILNTGIKGSLMLYWSFPVNPQMDIKKFQVFRRRSINESFELIKMFDFNDAVVKFPDVEETIDPSLIEMTAPNPVLSYYDDEFLKNSEYIYAIAAIDAHGFTSNYSEQFKVSFDHYKNKVITTLISTSGAPKNYPNLYLRKDLFVDTMKTSNKKTMNLYLTPDCYNVNTNEKNIKKVLGSTAENINYKINFINIENQSSSQLEIDINDLRKNATASNVSSTNFDLKK